MCIPAFDILQCRQLLHNNRRYKSPYRFQSSRSSDLQHTNPQNSSLPTLTATPSSPLHPYRLHSLLASPPPLPPSPIPHLIPLSILPKPPLPAIQDQRPTRAPPTPAAFSPATFSPPIFPPFSPAPFSAPLFAPGVFVSVPSSLALISRKWYSTMRSIAREPRKIARR